MDENWTVDRAEPPYVPILVWMAMAAMSRLMWVTGCATEAGQCALYCACPCDG